MSKIYKDIISKPELNFWIPIIFTAVTITLSWGSVLNKIALLDQKVGQLVEQNQMLIQKYGDVERRWGDVSQRVTILETRAGIR